jgi:hypothetical protein
MSPPLRACAAPAALVQVDDHALAQRALGRLQRVDAEVRGQRVQDGQAAGQHGRRSAFRPGSSSRSMRWPAARQRSMHQRRPVGRDAAVGDAAGASSCDTAPAVPDEPSASLPVRRGAKGCSASSSSAPAATCAARKPPR